MSTPWPLPLTWDEQIEADLYQRELEQEAADARARPGAEVGEIKWRPA